MIHMCAVSGDISEPINYIELCYSLSFSRFSHIVTYLNFNPAPVNLVPNVASSDN